MRLIDADTIFPNGHVLVWGKDGETTANYILKLIKDAPTLDVEPVRHGRWVKDHSYTRKNYELYYCTVCNHWQKCSIKTPSMNVLHMKYCPSCGAKMDGKESDDA